MSAVFCGKPLYQTQYVLYKHALYKSCPSCAKKNNEHKHLFYPEVVESVSSINNRRTPLYIPDKNKGYFINELRFLPMGKGVLPSEETVIEFLSHTVPERGYTYFYKTNKIANSTGTLMLFQYGGKLWGYALRISTTKVGDSFENDGSTYTGYYQFAPETFTVFDEPITLEEFSKIDSTFKCFEQAARKMPPSLLPDIMELLEKKGNKALEIDTLSQEIPEELSDSDLRIKEGAKKQIIVNAYERNPQARAICIEHYREKNGGKLISEICGFNFGVVYGNEFSNKMHIHHIVEISTIGEEYEVDACKDLIPICPNCHLIAHSRKPAYSPNEIRKMMRNLK